MPDGHAEPHLKELVEILSPLWQRSLMRAILVDLVPVVFTTSGINIDLVKPKETLSLPEIADSPEEEDNREGKIGLEELLGSGIFA